MQIALLRQRVGGPGGAETTVQHLARGLAAAGHEVTVYGSQSPDEARAVLGPQIAYVPVPVWGGKTGRLLTYALNTRRLLRRAGPQVVFSLERTLGQQVYRAGDGCHREWLRRRAPFLSPAARIFQRLSPFHRVLLALERRLFADPGLQRIIANSPMVKDRDHPALSSGAGAPHRDLQRPGPPELPAPGRTGALGLAVQAGRPGRRAPLSSSPAPALAAKVWLF